MGWILIYDQDTGELEYLGVASQRTPRERFWRWLKFLPGNVKRRYCRWANGGVLSRWTPPPFIGWSCPSGRQRPFAVSLGGSTENGSTAQTASGMKTFAVAYGTRSS